MVDFLEISVSYQLGSLQNCGVGLVGSLSGILTGFYRLAASIYNILGFTDYDVGG